MICSGWTGPAPGCSGSWPAAWPGSRAGFLAALRPGEESFFERAGLPRYELGPLDEQAANTLVTSRFPELAPRVRLRVVAQANGSPLALLELPVVLSGTQRAAAEALPCHGLNPPRLRGVRASCGQMTDGRWR